MYVFMYVCSLMAIDKGDKIISHAPKIDYFFTSGIFHSHAFEADVHFLSRCSHSNLGAHNRIIFQSQSNVLANKF